MNARRGAVALLTLVLLASGLAACATPTEEDTRSATAGMPNLQQDLAAERWRLDRADSSVRTEFEETVTLVFHADGTVSGRAPCNEYHGSYTTDLDTWTVEISHLATTRRACADATERAEREYLHALTLVRDVELTSRGHHLVLDNSTGDRLAYDGIDQP